MKILVFEYSTCVKSSNLLSEGFEILKSIVHDLEDVPDYNVDYLLRDGLDIDNIKRLNRIVLKEDLLSWLDINASNYDYSLFVAPEDNLIQYRITRLLENRKVGLLTSNSTASYTCCSKYLTYQKMTSEILKIPSIIMDTFNDDINLIKHKIEYNDIICKPDNYTSSAYIYHINKTQLDDIIEIYKNNNIRKMIIQEYIRGTPISISAIVNKEDVNIISINSQVISVNNDKISYTGCESPISHRLEKQIKELSKKIIKSVPGLKGFVGIDYIIDKDKIYFVEINSRITTPYVVLSKISEDNLTKYLIDSVINNKKMKKLTLTGKGEFYNE